MVEKKNLLGVLLHGELPKEQNKVGFMKGNGTNNHKVLSHMQIKCIVKLPLIKLNTGFIRPFLKLLFQILFLIIS